MSRLMLALSGVAVLAGALSAAGTASATDADRTARFLDPTGEDPAAPDITSVVVSNTRAGLLRFRIQIPNRRSFTDDMRVALWIDADDDPTTGLRGDVPFPGADYLVNWDRKQRPDASLLRCSGSRCTTVASRTLRFSYASGATFAVQAYELGDTRRFRFSARAYSGIAGSRETGLDFSNMRVDFAPQEGKSWRYELGLRRPVRPPTTELGTEPPGPYAGARFTVRLKVLDARGTIRLGGRVECTGTIGGTKLLPRSEGYVSRKATCVFALPEGTVGKTLRVTITVVFDDARVTRTFVRRVR